MKEAEEYLKLLFEEPFQLEKGTIEYDFLQVIKQAQLDAWNEAVKECADNADADFEPMGWLAEQHASEPFIPREDYEVYTIKSSILKLLKE